jgi:AraC family transcriptional regulator
MRPQDHLAVARHIQRNFAGDVSLGRVAKRAGWSPFHLQRAFSRALGETPKQFAHRLRLERAAARLVSSRANISQIARWSGFGSHEVFTRAFRRYFGSTPAHYRLRALAGSSAEERARHAAFVEAAGPCIRLHHFPLHQQKRNRAMPVLSISRKEQPAQPILFIRRRVAASEIRDTLAECFGKLFTHGGAAGLPMAGWPLARYVSTGPGLWTIEPAMPLAAPATSVGEMEAGFLHEGPVAVGIHGGPYEGLQDTHAAIHRWIETNGYRAAGAPWEWYVTDPGEHPDPADWRTEVYWPLEK